MMDVDFGKEGKYCRLNFGPINKYDDFKNHIEKIGLRNASTQQKVEFIESLLTDSRSNTMFDYAMSIASKDKTPEPLWASIITFFNQITEKDRITFVNRNFKLFVSDIPHFVTMLLTVEKGNSPLYVILKFRDTSFFKKYKKDIFQEILNQTELLDFNNDRGCKDCQEFLSFFREVSFQKEFLKKIYKKPYFNTMLFHVVLNLHVKGSRCHYLDINQLMEAYPDECSHAGMIPSIIKAILTVGYDEETGTRLVDIIKNQHPDVFEMQKGYLGQLRSVDLLVVKMYLFEVFQDPTYLPDDVRKVFTF